MQHFQGYLRPLILRAIDGAHCGLALCLDDYNWGPVEYTTATLCVLLLGKLHVKRFRPHLDIGDIGVQGQARHSM